MIRISSIVLVALFSSIFLTLGYAVHVAWVRHQFISEAVGACMKVGGLPAHSPHEGGVLCVSPEVAILLIPKEPK